MENNNLEKEILSIINSWEFNDAFMIFEARPEDSARYLSENPAGIKNNKNQLINNGLFSVFQSIQKVVENDVDLQTISDIFFKEESNHSFARSVALLKK